MTSLARIKANRANALKSTGPKTQNGKRRSAQNAIKHGIRARKFAPKLNTEEGCVLMRLLVSEEADADLAECAKEILETQYALNAVYAERDRYLEKLDRLGEVTAKVIRKIEVLDLYGRRIRSLQLKASRRYHALENMSGRSS